MSSLCMGLTETGAYCGNRARKSGFCASCDPHANAEEKRKQAKLDAEKKIKKEQAAEIAEQQLDQMIQECQSIEDLRMLELQILRQIVKAEIDPRAGSAIVNILKHQENLIDRKDEDQGDLKDNERARTIQKAKEMSVEQMLGLIGDFAHGMKKLIKDAKAEEAIGAATITVEAKGEYINVENGNNQPG